jgi:hypothetical protein
MKFADVEKLEAVIAELNANFGQARLAEAD